MRCPLRVVRIGVGFDLDMPLYWHVRFLQQGKLSLRSILFFFYGGKYPVPGTSGFEVFLLNPFGTFFLDAFLPPIATALTRQMHQPDQRFPWRRHGGGNSPIPVKQD